MNKSKRWSGEGRLLGDEADCLGHERRKKINDWEEGSNSHVHDMLC